MFLNLLLLKVCFLSIWASRLDFIYTVMGQVDFVEHTLLAHLWTWICTVEIMKKEASGLNLETASID